MPSCITPTQSRGSEGSAGRRTVVAPKDVYAVQINNQLKGAVNATITYSKGTSNELLVEKKHIPAGTSFKSGPYDYEEVRGAWTTRMHVR